MIKASQQNQDAPVAPLATRILFALRMGRPKFLIGGLLLHWLGVAMALASGAPLRLPALGLMPPVQRQETEQIAGPIVQHVIFGVATVATYQWLHDLT